MFIPSHNILELIGMPNSGKTSLGKRLEISDISNRLKYFSFRTSFNAHELNSNDDKMCIESLNSFQEALTKQLASIDSMTILIIDRGFSDKLIFYTILNELGLISEEPIKLCKSFMLKYSWHLSTKLVFNLPVKIVYEREKNARKSRDRWEIIFKKRTELAMQLLHNKYKVIREDHNSIIVDGQESMDSNFIFLKSALKKRYGL